MERQYLSGTTVDCMLITAARRAGCHSQVHHLFLNPCIRTSPARCDAYSRVDRTMNRTIATGNPPIYVQYQLAPNTYGFCFGRSASLQIYIFRHRKGPALQTIFTSVTFYASFANDSKPCQISTCLVGNYLGKHRLHPTV
jgi:hypothetical protein